jgi:predicted NBD/HSP70 family sugar kinase
MHIVFDIGGSKMRVARSDDGVTLQEPIVENTPEHFKEGVSLLVKAIRTLAKRKPIDSIGGGIAGIHDRETGMLLYSPNLRGWENHSLAEALLKLQAPIHLENDSALSGLGEAHFGAGRNQKIVMYMTISSGVGGVRIIDGKIDARKIGFEPGQQIIDHETLASLESLISGKALEKKYNQEPKLIDDPLVWKKVAEYLAIGLHNTILHWSPDAIVLGGPLMLNKIDISSVENHLKHIMIAFPELPELKLAELGDKSGLIGALEYIRQNQAL